MLLNKSVDTSHQVSIALNQFEAGGPVQAFRHDEQTPALPVPIGTPTDPLALILPPLSTTLLVVPPRLSRSLALVGGAAALILAGLAVARRRPERA
jgi:hypothetical protein